jgi:hypothetical protein
MSNGIFVSANGSTGGLVNLASWFGNVIMPTVAVLVLIVAIYRYAHQQDGERYIVGSFAALCVSGLVRLAETFVGTTSGPDQYWQALIGLANWTGNVILPVYAGLEVVRAVLAFRYFDLHKPHHNSWVRHAVVAGACLSVSALIRLLEYVITNGTAVGSS